MDISATVCFVTGHALTCIVLRDGDGVDAVHVVHMLGFSAERERKCYTRWRGQNPRTSWQQGSREKKTEILLRTVTQENQSWLG